MTSWLPKPLGLLLFRTVQRCVQALPARLIRIRPFGVYEICLLQRTRARLPIAADSPHQVRWIANQDEACRLSGLASAENIADWNGTTRRAAAVWQKDQPVAVAWIATESFPEDELGLRYRLYDNEVWLFAAVVTPALRRQGLYQQLLEFLATELSHENFQRILLGVSLGNQPSLRAHTRQGARQLGKIFAVQCLGLAGCKVRGRVQRISKRPWAWSRSIELAVDRG